MNERFKFYQKYLKYLEKDANFDCWAGIDDFELFKKIIL